MNLGLKEFAELVQEGFDGFLASQGFERVSSKLERNSFRADYRSGTRYVSIRANTDPRDDPPHFNLILGEGSLEWPEADWNAIALWHLRNFLEQAEEGAEYELRNASVTALIEQAADDLVKYGGGFLSGDTTAFKQARSVQNKSREPYTIHEPDGQGGYRTRIDPESARLKAKFSRE
jgi:hypothetical protein